MQDNVSSFNSMEFDESNDCFHRPKKSNSRRSMAPLFTYLIIKNAAEHLTHSEIIKILEKYPYEIKIERKSLSRIIHGLEDTGLGITSSTTDGVWYDPSLVWDI